MKNEQLEYYQKHNISPEHQDIADIDVHYARRKKLYRQCGIPEIAFRDAEILEVGPGGGYNTLAFFHWNCRHVDLVEANAQGIKDMQVLFETRGIEKSKYDMFECPIEQYKTDRRYDIIVAEGFLPDIYNQKEVLDKLKELVRGEGIIVITCVDKVDYFIEAMKRLVGRALTQNILNYEEKVTFLTDIFKPQLAKLRGVSKLPEDWVKDVILNPVVNNEMELSIAQAIRYFEEDFEILGASPQMFTDYSWSKDIWYDYKKDYLEQFDVKRLSLLMANMPEVILPGDCAGKLVRAFEDIRDAGAAYEKEPEICKINDILEIMNSIRQLVQENFCDEFVKVFQEIEKVMTDIISGDSIKMENYPSFFAAFGRTQQYISFVKK